jgi:hypothetical protein
MCGAAWAPLSAQVLTTVGAEADLSDTTAKASGRHSDPVAYQVDLGVTFAAISEVEFSWTFSTDNPLDGNDCLTVTGDVTGDLAAGFGVCSVGPESETERTLVFSCGSFPDVCDAYLDGNDSGLLEVENHEFNPAGRRTGRASITIESFAVSVTGVLASE